MVVLCVCQAFELPVVRQVSEQPLFVRATVTELQCDSLELIFFLPAWVTFVPLALALVCQVFVAWRSLPQPALTDAERSVAYLSFPARASGAQQSEVRTPKLTTTPRMDNEKGRIVRKREVELGEDGDDSSGDDRTV